jgi:hypothetical protein
VSKRGRPRRILCDETSNKSTQSVPLTDSDSDFAWAFTAARVLHTLDYSKPVPALWLRYSYIHKLRRSRRGQRIDQLVKRRDPEFLEAFVARYAPGWNWRDWREKNDDGEVHLKQIVVNQPDPRRVCLSWQCTEKLRQIIPTDPADWATLPGKIYYSGSRSRNDQIAKEVARMKRHDEARVNRFVTADEPDAGMFRDLRQRIIPTDPTAWPTLRELKLATAMPERTIKGIIANLRPTPRQAEIVTIPLRQMFNRCGAMPQRYGPRLVIGVLNEFVNRLPEFQIDDKERKRLRKIARGIVSGFSHSRSST